MSNIHKIETPLKDIKAGDTVMYKGHLTTVGKEDIKQDPFMGTSLFGACYPRTITKVLFAVPTNNGIIFR